MKNGEIHIYGIEDKEIEEWEKYARELGILFQEDKPPLKPLVLTRYTLDKMDMAWNKLFEQ